MMNKEKMKSDLTLKIFALLIAILLWAYVMNEVNPEIIRQYPNIDLEFSNVDSLDKEGLKLMSPQESKISVKVAGKKSDMTRFSGRNIKAIIDLRGYTEGQMKVPVKVSLENEMSNIQIIDYEPKEVMITFDKFVTTEKNITVRTIGQLPDSYVLGEIKIEPETVLLKGPRSYIKEVTDVVVYIDLEEKKKTGKTTAQIRLLNDQGNDLIGIEKDPKSVEANINILRSKEVKVEPKFNKELPEEFNESSIIINPSKIKIKGDEKVLDIGYIETETINVDELLSKKTIKVNVKLPEGIEKLDSKQMLTISLNEKQSIEKTIAFEMEDVIVENLSKNLVIEPGLNQTINMIVKGEEVEKLTKDDFVISLDFKDLEAGTYDMKFIVKSPSGIEVVSLTPEVIKVKLLK